jgi:hypothetical protein
MSICKYEDFRKDGGEICFFFDIFSYQNWKKPIAIDHQTTSLA